MTYDFIVLGLGGMGSAACYHLAKRGYKVAGLEQFQLGHERGSSHGQSRIIRKAYFEHPDYVPLLERAYRLWAELEAETARKLYHETGIVYSCPEESALLRGLQESSRRYNLPLETLDTKDIAPWFQTKPDRVLVRERVGGYLEVEACVQAHLERAHALGATLFDHAEVSALKITPAEVTLQLKSKSNSGNSLTTAVPTHTTLKAKKLVLTLGAWQSELFSQRLPLKVLKKSMYWFEAEDRTLESNGMPCFLSETPTGIFYGFPQTEKGAGLKVAEHSGGEAITHPKNLNRDLTQEFDRVRSFAQTELRGVSTRLLRHAPCMYTMTPDEHFIVDLHPDHENVAFAAGFSGHGFKFASVMGEALADLAEQGKTPLPIEFLSARRFISPSDF